MDKRIILKTFLTIVVIFALSATGTITKGAIIYVDDDAVGANDGSDWENAYIYLQDALADANSAEKPTEIRVAQGIYKPDQGTDVPYPPTWPANLAYRATFNLINGVTIKGGYAGFGESDPNSRDVELYKTILSGDLNGDDVDVNDPGNLFVVPKRGDNSSNVVTGSNTDATAVLDGFTISSGAISVIPFRGIGGSPAGGAGMLIFSGNPTLINCTFTDNVTGNSGGGLLLYDNSNPTLLNCKFIGNYAAEGGGVSTFQNSNPTLLNCMFSENYVQYKGGGMLSSGSNPKLTRCTFSHNLALKPKIYSSNTEGGGMYNIDSNPVLTDCTFIENSADIGSGIYSEDSDVELNTCEFISNMSLWYGGAICSNGGQLIAKGCVFEKNYPGAIEDYSTTGSMFTNCTFTGNSSRDRGGAVIVYEAKFSNCVFAGNRALGYYQEGRWHRGSGGAVFNKSTTLFKNCTFIKNWAENGNAIYNLAIGEVYVSNCIFRGSENQIHAEPYAPIFVRYSNVQSGWEGEGNIDIDPLFVNPGYWAHAEDPNVVVELNDPNAVWVDGEYHLKSQAGRWDPNSQSWVQDDVTSTCIDTGDPNSPIQHEPFPNGGIINMGAYGGTAEASKSYFSE